MPFLAEHVWRVLRADDAPESVFLAGWPEPGAFEERLIAEVAAVRRVVELGRQARSTSGLKLRQPLRRMVVHGAGAAEAHAEEISDELRVKEIEFGEVEAMEVRVKPNLPLLGPKLGKELAAIQQALAFGAWEQLPGGGVRVNGRELGPDEVLVERTPREGWALAEDDGTTVALSTELDDELLLEGRVLDLIHQVNTIRKEAGLELTDRIVLTLPRSRSDLLCHEEWIKGEVLALEVRLDDVGGPKIEKA
jgi:isoleucyl-tRNA synthetase